MRRHTLFPQLRLALLHRGDDHVADTGVGQSVEMRAETVRLDDEETLRAAVVSAVHHRADRKTESQAEFCAGGSSTWNTPFVRTAKDIIGRVTHRGLLVPFYFREEDEEELAELGRTVKVHVTDAGVAKHQHTQVELVSTLNNALNWTRTPRRQCLQRDRCASVFKLIQRQLETPAG